MGKYPIEDLALNQKPLDPDFENIFQENMHQLLENDSFNKQSISEWQKSIHEVAKSKGWYDTERSNTELLALAICELSEAIEEERKGTDTYYEIEGKPCGIQTEVADCIIRLLDMAESRGWDIEEVMQKKHKYNRGREYRHGNKKL